MKNQVVWFDAKKQLPPIPDENYLIAVKNKNKEGGIWIIDYANFNSDGEWLRDNTWEDVLFWAYQPMPPNFS